MARKYILTTTLTRHFIYFAKMMGFFPRIAKTFQEFCIHKNGPYMYWEYFDSSYYDKGSFFDFINYVMEHYRILNKRTVFNTYFFGDLGLKRFSKEEINELIDLFFVYLSEKKIYKFIRIEE